MKKKPSKRMKKNNDLVDHGKFYDLKDACAILKNSKHPKFVETVDVAIKLGIDTEKTEQHVRGVVSLPHGIGKKVKVAVFAKGEKLKEAQDAGADIVGGEELLESLKDGKIDFDRCIATPDIMPAVGKLGQILGPKGLMPNPKLGTVTNDVKQAVKSLKLGQVEFRSEKSGIVHSGVGKIDMESKAIEDNIRAFFQAVQKAKPTSVKGIYIKKVSIATTMGVGIKLNTANLKVA
jgi:large subunit ribosomal protein L1